MKYKRFDLVDPQEIIQKWHDTKEPIGVYVHSPFCKTICKFCVHRGVEVEGNQFQKYYDEYLPKVLEYYSPILTSKKDQIINWMFGGGTPSMVDPKRLHEMLARIPHFKESTAPKTFELHPGVFDMGQLDVLKEFNFTNIVLCVQSFDYDTLIKQNRVPASIDTMKALVKELRSRDFKISLDIIAYMNKKDHEYDILVDDLRIAYEEVQPDEISIQTLYQRRNDYHDKVVKAVMESKFVTGGNYFYEDQQSVNQSDLGEVISRTHWNSKCIRFFKMSAPGVLDYKDKDFFKLLPLFMDPSWKHMFAKKRFNTLAIGSYKNPLIQTHSNVENFNYIETNNDNENMKLKYVASSSFDELEYLMEIMRKVGEPPNGLEFYIKNKFVSNVTDDVPTFLEANFNFSSDFDSLDYIARLQKEIDKEKSEILKRLKS